MGLKCLLWSPAALNLKRRIEFINTRKQSDTVCQSVLKRIELPELSDEYLIKHLQNWLQPHLSIETSLKKLQKLDLYNIFCSLISWEQLQLLDQLAPEKIQVPSGSNIRIDYSEPQSPIARPPAGIIWPAADTGYFKRLLPALTASAIPGFTPHTGHPGSGQFLEEYL